MKSRNLLTRVQQFNLMILVRDTFVESAKTDAEFAASASEQLGFAITPGNVYHARTALGIEANKAPKRERPAVLDRLISAESRLSELERRFNLLTSRLGEEL